MSQMSPTKKNMTNGCLYQGHLVRVVPVWVGCWVSYNFRYFLEIMGHLVVVMVDSNW